MNWLLDLRLVSLILGVIATLMLFPAGIAISNGETAQAHAFALTIAIAYLMVAVSLLVSRKRSKQQSISTRDGYMLVTASWVLATVLGAFPLVVSGSSPGFTEAFFEIMSGFTTTGATVMADIDGCARSVLFWRSMTNWLGGMGFVVLFVALLPSLGVGGTLLYGAESVGPTKGKLVPKSSRTAEVLWMTYLGLSLILAVLLLLGGLSLYEAVTVTFSTISCAGFSVYGTSIGTFSSAYVDVVVTVFMLIGGTNFALFFLFFTGKFRHVFRNAELKTYLAIFTIAWLSCAAWLRISGYYDSLLSALRYSAFQIASVLTTTGFYTDNYCLWPQFSRFVVFVMMLIGGCAGSTAGGIKVTRIATVLKLSVAELKGRIHPRGVFPVKNGDEKLDSKLIQSISAFVALYLMIWLVSSALISLAGQDFETTLTSTLLCLGNIGIGFGKVNPTGNFLIFPHWAMWLFSFLMLIGRLELYTVLVFFTRSFWKK